MARVDDYQNAVGLGRQALEGMDPEQVALGSGSRWQAEGGGRGVLILHFLNRELSIIWPELHFSYQETGEVPSLQEQVLLLHYLKGALNATLKDQWIAYQEVPDGKFYLDAFLRRAKIPMVQVFGEQPETLVETAVEAYNARPFDQGDHSVIVPALPRIPVALILWRGDEEFPPDGNILFDLSIIDIFSAEDIAWLAGMMIYPLIGMVKKES